MNSSGSNPFCKQMTCPSSEMLLFFDAGGIEPEIRTEITEHLSVCEFCSAEALLLKHYRPQEEEKYELTVIPPDLRRLAESLLGGCALSMETFADSVYEKQGLSLTDA